MTKLLRCDFRRLLKSKLFYIALSGLIGLAVFAVLSKFHTTTVLNEPGYDTPDGILFADIMYIPFVAAMLNALFICTDFSDGTLRNKIIVGHGKATAYLSLFTVTSAALLVMHIAYVGVTLGLSAPLLSDFKTPMYVNITVFFCSLATIIAINAITVMLCMLIQNKALSLAFCILVAFGLFMIGLEISGALQNPEYLKGYSYEYEGEIIVVPDRKNQYYVSGVARSVLCFLYNLLPCGQAMIFKDCQALPEQVWLLPVYSAILALTVTLCGVLSFKRRNLK